MPDRYRTRMTASPGWRCPALRQPSITVASLVSSDRFRDGVAVYELGGHWCSQKRQFTVDPAESLMKPPPTLATSSMAYLGNNHPMAFDRTKTAQYYSARPPHPQSVELSPAPGMSGYSAVW